MPRNLLCSTEKSLPLSYSRDHSDDPSVALDRQPLEPEHSLDEERPLSPARQVSWLPDHGHSRAFPSIKDSGISGRLTGYSGASAADSHRFPKFAHAYRAHRAGLPKSGRRNLTVG